MNYLNATALLFEGCETDQKARRNDGRQKRKSK